MNDNLFNLCQQALQALDEDDFPILRQELRNSLSKPAEPKKLIIIIDSGMVQQVLSNDEIEVVIINYDIESVDIDKLQIDPYGEQAIIYPCDVETIEQHEIDAVFKTAKELL